MNKKKTSCSLTSLAWNLWCIVSIIGVWPRFIEPRILFTTKLNLNITRLPPDLEGLRIVQISDLHLSKKTSLAYLNRIAKKIHALDPDIIIFNGDFLCYSRLECAGHLKNFLNALQGRYGCYAVLGNHDYSEYVSISSEGDYAVIDPNDSGIKRGFKKLLAKTPLLTKQIRENVSRVTFHQGLLDLLNQTPFTLLHNTSQLISIKNSYLNICGLGEHMLGLCDPAKAFSNYRKEYPGIVVVHNPDSFTKLKDCPSDIILCGHTHGGQINLPWFRDKFLLLENKHFRRGLCKANNKLMYINRGLGGVMQFRWFSPPEVLLLVLRKG